MSGEDTLPRIYAKALLDLSFEKGVHREVLAELRRFAEVLAANERFTHFLSTPLVAQADKKGVIERAFGGHLSEVTLNFIRLVIDKRRELFLPRIVDAYEDGYHVRMDELVVRAQSAVPLSAGQRKALIQTLSSKFSKEIHLVESVSERLLGGLVLCVGDARIDGSLRSRLEAIGSRLEATRFRSQDYYED